MTLLRLISATALERMVANELALATVVRATAVIVRLRSTRQTTKTIVRSATVAAWLMWAPTRSSSPARAGGTARLLLNPSVLKDPRSALYFVAHIILSYIVVPSFRCHECPSFLVLRLD